MEVHVRVGSRIQRFELFGDDVTIGRASSCELQLFESSTEPVHAKLLKRRGHIILTPGPGSIKGVRLIDSLIRSPVIIDRNSIFEVGRVTMQAEIIDERSPLGESFNGYKVFQAIQRDSRLVRRYLAVNSHGNLAELCMLSKEVERPHGENWLQRFSGAWCLDKNDSSEVVFGEFDGRTFLLEPRSSSAKSGNETYGVRLSELDLCIDDGRLHLPVETVVAILAQVAEELAKLHQSIGPHGRIWPRTVHLHANGSVQILVPGPSTGSITDDFEPIYSFSVGERDELPRHIQFLNELNPSSEYHAPERRLDMQETVKDDIWALGVLARHLLGRKFRNDWPKRLDEVLVSARTTKPEVRAADILEIGQRLRDTAYELGLDPSISHISRVVHLFTSDLSRPLAVSEWTKRRDFEPNGDEQC